MLWNRVTKKNHFGRIVVTFEDMIIGFDAKRAFHNTSGLGNYSRDLIRILSEHYPENKYLLYNPKPGRLNWHFERHNIEVKHPEKWIWKRLSSIWRQGPITRQLTADGVEIFHGLSNEIPRGIDKRRTRVVVSIHDLIFIRFPELFKPVDRKIYFNKFKYAAENADLIIAISEQTKEDIVSYFKIPRQKIVVHYQGCHPAFKQKFSDEEKEALKKKLNLPAKYVLNVGTIEKRKNVLTVVRALENSHMHLVIIGRATAYKEELETFIDSKNMADRVHFLQGVTMQELPMIYQMAQLFCYPSLFEGFGIPIIEALFSKVPVITTAGGCFPEAGGPASRYLDPNDIPAWTDAIAEICSNEKLRKEMSSSGFQYVQRFRNENVGENLMAIYRSII